MNQLVGVRLTPIDNMLLPESSFTLKRFHAEGLAEAGHNVACSIIHSSIMPKIKKRRNGQANRNAVLWPDPHQAEFARQGLQERTVTVTDDD